MKLKVGFQKGHPSFWTEETKRKMSELMKGNHRGFKKGDKFWLNKHHSEGTKTKISIAKKGCKYPPRTKEWRRKISKSRLGSKSHFWKGGINPINNTIRHSIEYRFWVEGNFARDNYTCQKCKKRGGKLVAHHINNFSEKEDLRFAIDNGITFSKIAHDLFHKIYGRENNTKEQIIEFLRNG